MKLPQIQQLFFFSLLTATTAVFLWMLGSYLIPVFWAIVIAVVFSPLYKKIEKLVRGRGSIASILTIVAVMLLVTIPLSIIGGLIVQESFGLYARVTENMQDHDSASLIERAEGLLVYLEPYGISGAEVTEKVQSWTAQVTQVVAESLLTIGQGTFSFFIYTAITLYLLFFFFRDGTKLRSLLIEYLPLGDKYETQLLQRFAETSRAVVKGTLTIAFLQGLLGGLAFWIVGVSNPALWGVAMAILAIIPAVGPMVVWLPAGIILIVTGSLWGGITILAVGAALVSLVDEFLRPILVGRGSKMPDAVTLLATVGGLATFGISGFIVGPIIAAFFLSLWTMFGELYKKDRETVKR